jgi:hypothetical protein
MSTLDARQKRLFREMQELFPLRGFVPALSNENPTALATVGMSSATITLD